MIYQMYRNQFFYFSIYLSKWNQNTCIFHIQINLCNKFGKQLLHNDLRSRFCPVSAVQLSTARALQIKSIGCQPYYGCDCW